MYQDDVPVPRRRSTTAQSTPTSMWWCSPRSRLGWALEMAIGLLEGSILVWCNFQTGAQTRDLQLNELTFQIRKNSIDHY